MSCLSIDKFTVRFGPVERQFHPKKQRAVQLTDLSLCLYCPPDALITTEWRQDLNLPCRRFGIWNFSPAFPLMERFISYGRPPFATRLTGHCCVLHSEGRGRLDFGGQDLPESPLQLLHGGRFGSCQVEAASSFLTVYSSQCSEHLKHRQRCEALK